MKSYWRLRTFITSVIFLFFTTTQAQKTPYRIDSLKAFLFYNSNNSLSEENVQGTFSENLIDNDTFALWNTIIGAGSAKGVSNETFVVVKIKGNPKEYVQRTLTLTAYGNNKQIFKQSEVFAILDEKSEYVASFLLYNTGCDKIKLKAEITYTSIKEGKKVPKVESSLEKTIPFACGE